MALATLYANGIRSAFRASHGPPEKFWNERHKVLIRLKFKASIKKSMVIIL